MIVLIITFGSLYAQQDEILELIMDLFAQNSIELKGKLETGKYKFRAVLKDKLGKKTATKTIEFEIR